MEREYARLYHEIGLGTTIWSPLASGILTGKYEHGMPDGTRFSVPDYEWLRENIESERGQANIDKARRLRPLAPRPRWRTRGFRARESRRSIAPSRSPLHALRRCSATTYSSPPPQAAPRIHARP